MCLEDSGDFLNLLDGIHSNNWFPLNNFSSSFIFIPE